MRPGILHQKEPQPRSQGLLRHYRGEDNAMDQLNDCGHATHRVYSRADSARVPEGEALDNRGVQRGHELLFDVLRQRQAS